MLVAIVVAACYLTCQMSASLHGATLGAISERRTRNSLDTSENPRLRNRGDMTRELYAFMYGSFRMACMIVTGKPEREGERQRGKKEVDIELM